MYTFLYFGKKRCWRSLRLLKSIYWERLQWEARMIYLESNALLLLHQLIMNTVRGANHLKDRNLVNAVNFAYYEILSYFITNEGKILILELLWNVYFSRDFYHNFIFGECVFWAKSLTCCMTTSLVVQKITGFKKFEVWLATFLLHTVLYLKYMTNWFFTNHITPNFYKCQLNIRTYPVLVISKHPAKWVYRFKQCLQIGEKS